MGYVLALLVNAIILATPFAGLYLLVRAIGRARRGQGLIPWWPRREVPWGFIDLSIILIPVALLTLWKILLWIEGTPAIAAPPVTAESAQQRVGLQVADSLLQLTVVFGVTAFITFRSGATKRDWGWDPKHLAGDILLGLKMFAVVVPAVLALQGTLVYVFGWKSEHPLLENLKASPSIDLFAVSLVAAVFVAPLAEEWAFRVLFQGWLEKVASGQFNSLQLMMGGERPFELAHEEIEVTADEALPLKPVNLDNPYRSPAPPPVVMSSVIDSEPPPARTAWWPMIVSAAIFAVVHISHGPDFVPLFFLAIGLGYLYRQTHRIVPSLVVHLCLNLLTMIGMGAQLLIEKASP